MLFKWFLDLPIDGRAFDATTFTKNRQRLQGHEIADRFFAAVVAQAKLRRYMSSDHFSVDGTLLQAWAANKSFKPDRPDGEIDDGDSNGFKGRNTEVDFKGQNGRTRRTPRPLIPKQCCSARATTWLPSCPTWGSRSSRVRWRWSWLQTWRARRWPECRRSCPMRGG